MASRTITRKLATCKTLARQAYVVANNVNEDHSCSQRSLGISLCCAFSRRCISCATGIHIVASLHIALRGITAHEASLLAQLLSRGITARTTALTRHRCSHNSTSNMLALRHLARRTAARGFATSTNSRTWKVYLRGEIHSDWREVIGDGVSARNLPVTIDAPNTSHEDSDDCGAIILGDEEKRPNYDNKGARLNLIRTRTLIDDADVVVVSIWATSTASGTRLLMLATRRPRARPS